jgi:hypothetical protein
LTIGADFSVVRMGKRWRKAFEVAVPLAPLRTPAREEMEQATGGARG